MGGCGFGAPGRELVQRDVSECTFLQFGPGFSPDRPKLTKALNQ